MDLSPHLYVLPLELTPFVDVLAALGVQEAFSVAQYTRLLQVRLLGLGGVSWYWNCATPSAMHHAWHMVAHDSWWKARGA